MSKLSLLAAFGVGYVLGARAGRERYEQIATGARKVAGSQPVQAASHKAQEKVSDTFGRGHGDFSTGLQTNPNAATGPMN